MYNADGSLGAMCGNGIRCVGKYVYDHGLTNMTTITVETGSGIKTLDLNVVNGRVSTATVDMGAPVLTSNHLDMEIPVDAYKILTREQIWEDITVDGKVYKMISVSMGNPHAIIFVENTDEIEIEKIGPKFENHERFPDRTNTEFIQVIDEQNLKMRVWERGSGETMACGTGACASLVAASLAGFVNQSADIRLLGGTLQISINKENGHVIMTGPATEVFEGTFNI
jgi:diaminopimelate epimerase